MLTKKGDDVIILGIFSKSIDELRESWIKVDGLSPDFHQTGLKKTSIIKTEKITVIHQSLVRKELGSLSSELIQQVYLAVDRLGKYFVKLWKLNKKRLGKYIPKPAIVLMTQLPIDFSLFALLSVIAPFTVIAYNLLPIIFIDQTDEIDGIDGIDDINVNNKAPSPLRIFPYPFMTYRISAIPF